MNCRVCGANTRLVFSLGPMPLANSLLDSPDQPFKRYPLDLMLCEECSLVQLSETVPPEELFVDYAYLTSCSPPMVEHAKQLVDKTLLRTKLDCAESLVVEVGSNDGYLLQHYVRAKIPCLGIDPSEIAADAAEKRGVPTLVQFFNSKTVIGLERADVIHANNVLAHVPDLNDFVSALATLLKPDGTLIVEVPYLCELIDKTAFDNIYHEHVYYFSVMALDKLFTRHGLFISQIEEIPTHGGSLRLWIEKANRLPGHFGENPFPANYFSDFAARVEACKRDTRELLSGRCVVGFGAAAKATIFLNACGITRRDMLYVADDTPTKQGKYIPGTGIPIVSTDVWLLGQREATMILAWNFAHDIAHCYATAYHGELFTWYSGVLARSA